MEYHQNLKKLTALAERQVFNFVRTPKKFAQEVIAGTGATKKVAMGWMESTSCVPATGTR
jgi:hypothetical protein